MFKAKFIVFIYMFLFVGIGFLLLLGENFGSGFRAAYGEPLIQLFQSVVAAFIGFLTAFAAEKDK